MRGYRKNSLVIDFTVLPAKPSIPEVRDFIFNHMKLEMTHIKNLQLFMQKSYVFIELVPEIAAEGVVDKLNRKFCMKTSEGVQKPIPLFLADGAVEVKIYDLPPYMPEATIAKQLRGYGEVLSIRGESWHDFFPGIPNGTRVVRMRLKNPIPSYLPIEDQTAFIRYRNQPPTCKHCARDLHIGKKCSEIKKALAEAAAAGLTLAEILQGRNPDNQNPPIDATDDEDPPLLVEPPEPNLNQPTDDNEENRDDSGSAGDIQDDEISEEENIDDEDIPVELSEEESVIEPTPVNPNSKQDRAQGQPEPKKPPTGKRPGSPKGSNREKRPSRSSSRK